MRDDDRSTLGSVLRHSREQHDLDRKQLAHLLDVAPSQVTRWEQDEALPSPKSLTALARQLELKASVLFNLACIPLPTPELTELPAMLRAELDLPPDAIREVQQHIQEVAARVRKQQHLKEVAAHLRKQQQIQESAARFRKQ